MHSDTLQHSKTSAKSDAEQYTHKRALTHTHTRTHINANANEQNKTESMRSKLLYSKYIIMEYFYEPVKVFQIPRVAMLLSEEAKHYALEVENNHKRARDFLDHFGDHVSAATQTLGGIMVKFVETDLSESVTSEEIKKAAAESFSLSGDVGQSTLGVSYKHDHFYANSSTEGNATKKLNRTTKVAITTWGPSRTTWRPQRFRSRLRNDNSTWNVIDRGFVDTACIPVWDFLEEEGYPLAAKYVHHAYTRSMRVPLLMIQEVTLKQSPPLHEELFIEVVRSRLYSTLNKKPYHVIQMVFDLIHYSNKMEAEFGSENNQSYLTRLLEEHTFVEHLWRVISEQTSHCDFDSGKEFICQVFGKTSSQKYLIKKLRQQYGDIAKEVCKRMFSKIVQNSEEVESAVPLKNLAAAIKAIPYTDNHSMTQRVANLLHVSLYNGSNKLAQEMRQIAKKRGFMFDAIQFRAPLEFEDKAKISKFFDIAQNENQFKKHDIVLYYDDTNTKTQVTPCYFQLLLNVFFQRLSFQYPSIFF